MMEDTDPSGYSWPENLYIELRDMGGMAFLAITFGYICDLARKVDEPFVGVQVSNHDKRIARALPTSELGRSFSPKEILIIIRENRELLMKHYPNTFDDDRIFELILHNLRALQERADSDSFKYHRRPLTIEQFDDRHPNREMAYGICRDDTNKRITLVFRGTATELSMKSTWTTNTQVYRAPAKVPECLRGVISKLFLHYGFLKYVFSKTKTDTEEGPGFRKYEEIYEDITWLLQANPDYKLYITGHGLGAGLATIVSFYMACDPAIPRPLTCITFAAPRVGDENFLAGTRWLEEQGWLRMLRVVNDKDTATSVPTVGYHHVGMQLTLFRDKNNKPFVSYPKDAWLGFGRRLWRNSFMRSFNARYEHSDYRERIDTHEMTLRSMDLNQLYDDKELVGYHRKDIELN